MVGPMRLIHRFVTIVLTALVMFAPLLCVRFCHLRAEVEQMATLATMTPVAQTMPDMSMMPVMHYDSAHTPASGTHEHHAPLDELKQMVTAVTEFVVAPAPFATVIVVIRLALLRASMPRLLMSQVPTPPPKFTRA